MNEILILGGVEMKVLKKWTAVVLSLLFTGAFFVPCQALDENSLTAPSVVLMEETTGKVLFEKNAHELRACASITKVMTLLLVFEAIDSGKISMTDTVTASEHAASMGGSDIWLETGESMTVDEMIKATVVASANDAAVALAEYICGSEEEFVARMNARAKELGMKDTTFKNCNGLDEEGHLTSAYDVALMSRALMAHEKIYEYTGIWIDYLRGGKTQLVNTNKLLKSYNGITGLKTGTTGQAGSCISATAKRDGLSLIAVVLGSATGKERFTDAAKVLDYGFANFAMYEPTVPEGACVEVKVNGGMKSSVKTKVDGGGAILISKGSQENIESKVQLETEFAAPIAKGQTLGKVIYYEDGKEIASCPIKAESSVEAISFFGVLERLFKALIFG